MKDPNIRANRETFPLQQKANKAMMELAGEYGVKLVCTNDAHFVDQDNAEAHDHLLCLATGKDLDDPKRMLYSKQEWFKTRAEMNTVFGDLPQVMANTLEILDKVEMYSIDHDPIVGPGRGSAAGSVVAYCLGITKIDPIKYDLLFERFLNPDRISLPDIDTDFDDDGRGRVLEWVEDKYGHDKVAHIITYGTMATKNSIKDVARVEKLPLDISNRLCKAIPDRLPDGMKMNLPNAIKA